MNTAKTALRLAALLVTGVAAGTAAAATIAVTTTADSIANDGQCSLREAITAANADSAFNGCVAGNGVDEIVLAAAEYRFELSGAGEDANASGDLDVRSSLVLRGAGADVTRIRGDREDRVFDLAMPGAGQPIIVSLQGVTVRNGSGALGGAVLNNAGVTLLVSGCSFTGNAADQGAGIASMGVFEIENSVFHANDAVEGGAIWTSGSGSTAVRNVTFDSNTSIGSGSAAVLNAAASFNNVTLSQNIADSDFDDIGDGAIVANASVSLSNSIIARNVDLSLGGGALVNPDCAVGPGGTLDSTGYNLIGNIGNTCTLSNAQASDQVGIAAQPINPLLQPFAIYGGTVEVFLPTVESPAVERGSPAPVGDPGACEATDARGVVRPQASRCDIGAAELDDLIFRDGFDPPLP
jgi:CSLREA domain-containing protein